MGTRQIYVIFVVSVLLLVPTLGAIANAQDNGPILVGHLTYHTGPFADVGPRFDGVTDFTLEIINQDPPLGRELMPIHEDIGTIGEARAAKKLVEFDGVEILLNPAHNYGYYRDWLVGFVTHHDRPIMPSVHGGAINREIGGLPTEPLFRGSPMDSAQSVAAVVYAQQSGAENIAIIAAEIEGHQLQKDAAIAAATTLGLPILAVIDVQAELPNYLNAVKKVQEYDPDAILVFAAAVDGGLIVQNAAEVGLTSMIIGTTEWQAEEFFSTAVTGATDSRENVWVIAFTHADSPAWDFYEPLWNDSDYAGLATAENSYNLQYYDLLNVTALAIEAAGTTDASIWTEYVPVVAEAPGVAVYSYQEGIEALRNGQDIDYSGISGEMNYTTTGVVSGLFGVFQWTDSGELVLVTALDENQIMDLDK